MITKVRIMAIGVAAAAALSSTLAVSPTAEARGSTDAYCVQDLAGGPQACFTTERALESYQAKLSLSPLLTVFQKPGWHGADGYLNFVSAYGRSYCDAAIDKNEASAGDLNALKFSNGQTVDKAIGSYVIKANSGCVVTFWDQKSFKGIYVTDFENCIDMATCFTANWDNRAHSLAVT